jgi:hypothetical protein
LQDVYWGKKMFETYIVAEKNKTHVLCPKHFFGKVTIFDLIKRDNMLIFPNPFVVNNALPNIPIQPSKKQKKYVILFTLY